MTKFEQLIIAKELVDTLEIKMAAAVEKAPEEWDGIELRWLLADLAAECKPDPKLRMGRKRRYTNTRRVEGI